MSWILPLSQVTNWDPFFLSGVEEYSHNAGNIAENLLMQHRSTRGWMSYLSTAMTFMANHMLIKCQALPLSHARFLHNSIPLIELCRQHPVGVAKEMLTCQGLPLKACIYPVFVCLPLMVLSCIWYHPSKNAVDIYNKLTYMSTQYQHSTQYCWWPSDRKRPIPS